jgi:hypothetical protein
MKRKIEKLAARIAHRESITALSMIVIVAATSAVLAFFAGEFARFKNLKDAREKRHNAYEDELRRLSGLTVNLAPAPDPTADWKTYANRKYGISLKYPQNWQDVRESFAGREENFLLKISFDETAPTNGKNVEGFDVFVFDAAKFPGPTGTDNLKKKNDNAAVEDCPRFDDITLGETGYPAKEVDISANNPCWEETFFYSLSKNGYTFNIVPRLVSSFGIKNFDEKIFLTKTFPLFYDIVSTLDFPEKETEGIKLIPQKVAQKTPSTPKVRYTSGARCNHKNDKPRKSKTKGKHMDEDYCPDPDEWPNPRCAYSSGGLGLMRSRP